MARRRALLVVMFKRLAVDDPELEMIFLKIKVQNLVNRDGQPDEHLDDEIPFRVRAAHVIRIFAPRVLL